MTNKLLLCLTGIILVIGLLFSGCDNSTPATTSSSSTSSAPTQKTTTAAATTPLQNTVIATSAAPAGSQQYGGVLKYTPSVSPGGPIGWPSEAIGTMSGTQHFALEPLLMAYWDGRLEPWLATGWKVADDLSSITFTLRKGVKFHDGTDFNADAVKFNFDWCITNKTSVASYWSSIDVINDYTVRVNVKDYFNTMLTDFAGGSCFMVSPTAYEKNGVEWMRENMVGTGPFKLKEFTRDVRAVFERNPDYWQESKPYLDGVEVLYFADMLTESAALQVGDLDVMKMDTGSLAATLRDKMFTTQPRLTGVIGLMYDSANSDSPFSDVKVRQAVDYAINKDALIKAKGYGFWSASYQIPPPGTEAYDPDYMGRHYNVDKAKQLLTEAGYPNGFAYRFVISPQGTDQDVAMGIQNFLSKVGIDLSLEYPVYSKYLEYRQVSTWSGAMLMQPLGINSNLNRFFSNYIVSTGGLFKSLYRPEGLDEMVNECRRTPEPDAEKIKELAKYVYEEALLLPIHDTGQVFAFDSNIVHDAGFLTMDNPSHFQPWNVWLSR